MERPRRLGASHRVRPSGSAPARHKCGSCPKCVWFLPMHCIFCIFCIRMHHLHYNCITTAFADCISLHYAIFARDCISLHYAIFVALCNICIRCIRCILRVIAFRCIMQYLHSLHFARDCISLHLRVISLHYMLHYVYSGHDCISFAI